MDAGYRARIEAVGTRPDGAKMCIYAAYDSQRGVSITRSPCDHWISVNARRDGRYRVVVKPTTKIRKQGRTMASFGRTNWGTDMAALNAAIEFAATLTGEPPRKKKKSSLIWRAPNKAKYVKSGGCINTRQTAILNRSVNILKAALYGFCRLEPDGSITLDVVDPNGSDVYLCIRVWDFRDRSFYIILKDETKFVVARRRGNRKGKPLIKSVAGKCLFGCGRNDLYFDKINDADIAFVLDAVREGLDSSSA